MISYCFRCPIRNRVRFSNRRADVGSVRLVLDGVACEGCPPIPDLMRRYAEAGGRYLVCPICFDAKKLDKGDLLSHAELGGTVPLWEWIGDDSATTFSY